MPSAKDKDVKEYNRASEIGSTCNRVHYCIGNGSEYLQIALTDLPKIKRLQRKDKPDKRDAELKRQLTIAMKASRKAEHLAYALLNKATRKQQAAFNKATEG